MKIASIMDTKEESTVVETPPVVQQQQPSATTTKKYRIALAVLACVTILAVVSAFVGVFYIQSQTVEKILRHQHIEYTSKAGSLSEEVEIDDEENIATYTVFTDDGVEFQVIEDYGRRLAVMEVLVKNESACSVYVMNTVVSSTKDLKEMQEMLTSDDVNITIYELQDQPVASTDFLSGDAQKMCAGREVFWAIAECGDQGLDDIKTEEDDEDDDEESLYTKKDGVRVRRGWWRKVKKFWSRVWSFTRTVGKWVYEGGKWVWKWVREHCRCSASSSSGTSCTCS